MNSETLGLLYTSKYPISVSPCEPELYSHFRPHTHHNPIYFTNFTINNPNSPWSVTDCTNGFQNFPTIWFQDLGPIKRPLTASINSNIINTLKQSVKLKYDETPTSRSLSKTPKTGTHALPSLHRTAFLLAPKNSNSRIARNLREMSHYLSLKIKTKPSASPFPPPHVFSWIFEGRG